VNILKKKTTVRMIFENNNTLEIEVNNPHISWFIVETNGKQEIFTKSGIIKNNEEI